MAQLNLDQLQAALLKVAAISQTEGVTSSLTADETAQLQMVSSLVSSMQELTKLGMRSTLGGFIPKTVSAERHQAFTKWRQEHASDLKPLILFEPMGCSASLVKELLGRAKDGDFLQLSLGMDGDQLNYLMAIVDQNGDIRPGQRNNLAKVMLADGGGDDDVLDDMRPCPPCQ